VVLAIDRAERQCTVRRDAEVVTDVRSEVVHGGPSAGAIEHCGASPVPGDPSGLHPLRDNGIRTVPRQRDRAGVEGHQDIVMVLVPDAVDIDQAGRRPEGMREEGQLGIAGVRLAPQQDALLLGGDRGHESARPHLDQARVCVHLRRDRAVVDESRVGRPHVPVQLAALGGGEHFEEMRPVTDLGDGGTDIPLPPPEAQRTAPAADRRARVRLGRVGIEPADEQPIIRCAADEFEIAVLAVDPLGEGRPAHDGWPILGQQDQIIWCRHGVLTKVVDQGRSDQGRTRPTVRRCPGGAARADAHPAEISAAVCHSARPGGPCQPS